jgi:hypothetical protein
LDQEKWGAGFARLLASKGFDVAIGNKNAEGEAPCGPPISAARNPEGDIIGAPFGGGPFATKFVRFAKTASVMVKGF